MTAWVSLKKDLARTLGWSLSQIDDCDVESLMQFLNTEDPDTRIIDGITYKRSKGIPDFL